MKLTEKLDMLMEERGINRVDLSKESDIPYSTIASLYDKGYENAKLSTLKKLAHYFNCSLDYIADDSVEDRNKTVDTIAAHHPDNNFTEEELQEIEKFKEFVKARRLEE